jgi:hypothetical protein
MSGGDMKKIPSTIAPATRDKARLIFTSTIIKITVKEMIMAR